MRMRSKPWAKPELADADFFLEFPQDYKGQWQNLFANPNPIHLELGCGKGSFVAQMAAQNSNINYIAIDINNAMLGLTKRNIEKQFALCDRAIDNVKITWQDIERIFLILDASDKVERIYINFCNPWPKLRHKKKRLTHSRQLEKYKAFLSPQGEIWFKTDDDLLFEESKEYFEESGFVLRYQTTDLHASAFEGSIATEHEEMFSNEGIKIKFLIAIRKD